MNWIRKYWWVILLCLALFPFVLNFAVTRTLPFDWRIAGEPSDWIMFWGAYISSIASLVMVYYTYCIIKQNDEIRRGRIVCSVIYHNTSYFLQVVNVGSSQVYDITLSIGEEFLSTLHENSSARMAQINNKKFSLMPNESKYIPIECGVVGKHKSLNIQTDTMEDAEVTKEYLKIIKNAMITVHGKYFSIGKQFTIDYELVLSDYTSAPFARVENATQAELPLIRKALETISKKIKN